MMKFNKYVAHEYSEHVYKQLCGECVHCHNTCINQCRHAGKVHGKRKVQRTIDHTPFYVDGPKSPWLLSTNHSKFSPFTTQ